MQVYEIIYVILLMSVGSKRSLLNRVDTPLVLPIITPRFVPTCTEGMMRQLGVPALTHPLVFNTHISLSFALLRRFSSEVFASHSKPFVGIYL